MWAQEVGYDGPNWQKFNIDLSQFAGKKVRFSFNYKGLEGEDVLIDGFRLTQTDYSEQSSVSINEGETVHYQNASTGNILSYQWTFEGGTPSESVDENPSVRYDKAGTYPVSLTVHDGTSTHTYTRNAYINVVAVAPKAWIGLPEGGYLSPYVASFVPTHVPVQFTDQSEGKPTEWHWQFYGTDTEVSHDQHPTVTYIKEGKYSVALRATNAAGVNTDVMQNAIQAGGEQHIWNIHPDESLKLGQISLGWYGNYAGSNFLGMRKFAEHFSKPLAKATIKNVNIFFVSTTTVSPNDVITVSIAKADENGMPGESLGKSSLKVSQLALFTNETAVATLFAFDTPIAVDDDFFVVVEGMPNVSNENGTDDVAILALRRDQDGRSTTYHELAEEDENYQFTGNYTWYKSEDDKVSLAVCPLLVYVDTPTGIEHAAVDAAKGNLYFDGTLLHLNAKFDVLQVYTIGGNSVMVHPTPSGVVSLQALPAGMYVVKVMQDNKQQVLKIVKK